MRKPTTEEILKELKSSLMWDLADKDGNKYIVLPRANDEEELKEIYKAAR